MNIDWEKLNLDPQLLWADYILPWGTQIVLALLTSCNQPARPFQPGSCL